MTICLSLPISCLDQHKRTKCNWISDPNGATHEFPVQLTETPGRDSKLLFKATGNWGGGGLSEIFFFKTWYEVPGR